MITDMEECFMVSIVQLIKEMPEGYENACFDEKAIQRKRGITNPDDLMMLVLFHLLQGCSLLEISTIATLTKIGDISDVAFMKRFEKCNGWFKRIISDLVTNGMIPYQKPELLENYNIIAVDATDVKEKGRSGRIYRLHFALDLFKMESLQYSITTQKIGETLRNFRIGNKDLVVADRAYASLSGIEHCLNNGGNFILRFKKNCFKLFDVDGNTVELLDHLRSLGDGKALNLNVFASGADGKKITLRVCAKRKTADDIAQTQKRLHQKESKMQEKISDDAIEYNQYIILITALPDEINADQILEIYRLRWQVEIYFKRLKTIMDFGELPKRRPDSVMAWLNGKLMVALLIEKIIGKTDFSPSGKQIPEHMA
jgi:hypothetical protein